MIKLSLSKSLRVFVLCRNLVSFTYFKNLSTLSKVVDLAQRKKEAVKNLQEILDIKYNKAYEIASQASFSLDVELLKCNLELCNKHSVNKEKLLQYPKILFVNLERRFEELKFLPYPIDITFILAGLKPGRFSLLINKYEEGDDKINLLAELLQVSHEQSCEILYKRDFLLSKESENLREVVMLLTEEANVSLEDIRKDLWALRYNEEAVRERIELVKQHNIEFIKTWMIRAPIDIIENYARRRTDTRKILGDHSLTEYLSTRLECPEDQSKAIVQRMPALKTKSLRKLKALIDFLYSRGFKPYHIYRVPKILVHSIETTKKRLKEIEKKGLHVDSLYMLTKSQKQYKQFFESLEKNKKVKKTLE